jgi:hypothetical protein
MSELGQTETTARERGMSVGPLAADIVRLGAQVRFVATSRHRWSGLRPTRCRSEYIRVTEKVLNPKTCLR